MSDGFGKATFDEQHQKKRQQIMDHSGGTKDQLVAGVKGFGLGLVGGLTSIVTQTYSGASQDGVTVSRCRAGSLHLQPGRKYALFAETALLCILNRVW